MAIHHGYLLHLFGDCQPGTWETIKDKCNNAIRDSSNLGEENTQINYCKLSINEHCGALILRNAYTYNIHYYYLFV